MLKTDWEKTTGRFDKWWARKTGTVLIVADIKRSGPIYSDLEELTNTKTAFHRHLAYLKNGAFFGDAIPDMSAYLGPGSLCTFIGAEPIHRNNTIWYKDRCSTFDEVRENCIQFIEGYDSGKFLWYDWSLRATEYYKAASEGEFMTSMPDLQQNLDILAAVMGADRMFMEIIDYPKKAKELLELLFEVWKKAFNAHHKRIIDNNGYSAYTHYNIMGKGKTSVLQSDISCMMSCDMFDAYEMPFLKKQCRELDNVIYHLDGPGAIRHLDSILTLEKVSAIQWVPGAGRPGNADGCWHHLYDKIAENGKGIYIFLWLNEIDAFVEKYGDGRLFIRTFADTCEEQERLVNKYI